MEHTKGLLLITLWLLALPFAFAQDITDFKRVIPTAQYKQQGGYMYCTLTHNSLGIRLTLDKAHAEEWIVATVEFLIDNKTSGPITYVGTDDPFDYFSFYQDLATGSYYILKESYDDLVLYYEAYKVSGNTVTHLGDFYSEDYHDYITNEFTTLSAPGTDTAWFVISGQNGKKIELKKSTYVDTEDTYVYANPPLLEKHNTFNWQKGFTPILKYTITFDLNGDGEFEKFNIDWAKKEISYANTNALLLLKDEFATHYIRFEGETLLLSMPRYWRTDIDTYTYHFSISKKYNTACLDKYSYFTYRSYDDKDGTGTVVACNFKEDYFPNDWERIRILERFSIEQDEYKEIFQQWGYERHFTVSGLAKMLSKKETANNFENLCAPYPSSAEMDLLVKNNPLTAANVQQYNDLAYYMLEHKAYDEYHTRILQYSARNILENITTQFPNRVVAWLNLADAYAEDKAYKDNMAAAYKKYLELMRAQGKEAKVPQRVYDRIK
jgi:hypothetical protein